MNIEVNSIRQAYDLGSNAAADVRIGAAFTGAFGAADAAGYSAENIERSMFVSAYLANLPGRIRADKAGVVVAITC